MLRLLAATIGIVLTTFVGTVIVGDEPDSIPKCAQARPIEPRSDLPQGMLRMEIRHEGVEMEMVFCILDMDGRKVAQMTGTASGQARLILESELPLGEYQTIVEGEARGIFGGGSFALSQGADLRDCLKGDTVTRGKTHHYLLGSGVEGGGVHCEQDGAAAGSGTQPASRPKPVGQVG